MGLIGSVLVVSRVFSAADAVEVEMEKAQTRDVRATIIASGAISFVETVDLRPEITGVVSKINVRTGDIVSEGDILLEFDQSALRAELSRQVASIASQGAMIERARGAMERADRQAQRSHEIFQRQLLSHDAYDDIRTAADLTQHDYRIQVENLNMVRAVKRTVEENLRKMIIRAPFDGQVVDVSIAVGETAVAGITNIAGSQLLTLADTRDVVADLLVDEIDISRVAPGQPVSVEIIAFPGKQLRGRVSNVGLAGQPKQGNESLKYRARVTFPDGAKVDVLKDMTVRAEIETSASEAAVAVPLRAVLSEPSGQREKTQFVFIEEDGRARKRLLELGRSDDEYQVAESGLEAGQMVVVGPHERLRNLHEGDRLLPAGAK